MQGRNHAETSQSFVCMCMVENVLISGYFRGSYDINIVTQAIS
ncbi:hypothetical protein Mpsy_2280 [Methanolobus psychrophilus R15]|nr:hypothetical protein Mpsy_2280 [Methanolobus psychrophilus R15]